MLSLEIKAPLSVSFLRNDREYHRVERPAVVNKYVSGKLRSKKWIAWGGFYRPGKYAMLTWREHSGILRKFFFDFRN